MTHRAGHGSAPSLAEAWSGPLRQGVTSSLCPPLLYGGAYILTPGWAGTERDRDRPRCWGSSVCPSPWSAGANSAAYRSALFLGHPHSFWEGDHLSVSSFGAQHCFGLCRGLQGFVMLLNKPFILGFCCCCAFSFIVLAARGPSPCFLH